MKRARLSRRIRTLAGDIRQSLPRGFDVVMFCDTGAVSRRDLRNAYQCLPAKGLLVLADRYNMVQAVKSRGFQAVRARKTYRDLWVITGTKPDRHTGAV